MSAAVTVTVGPATVRGTAPLPIVDVAVNAGAATAIGSAGAATFVVLGPTAILAYEAIPPPHPHLPADHDDPLAVGVELGVAVAAVFVGFKLVAGRRLRL